VNLIARPDSDFAALSHRDAKKQKNFFKLDRAGENAWGPLEQKFFGYFFSKK
jgi:hypothetical protein